MIEKLNTRIVKFKNKNILLAIATYYVNRNKQNQNPPPSIKWNKEGDLNNLTKALPKGWGYEACVGTFWIHRPTEKHWITYKIDESSFPNAEMTIMKRKPK